MIGEVRKTLTPTLPTINSAFGPVAILLISAIAYRTRNRRTSLKHFFYVILKTHLFELMLFSRSYIHLGAVLSESRCHHLPYTRSSTRDENLVYNSLTSPEKLILMRTCAPILPVTLNRELRRRSHVNRE